MTKTHGGFRSNSGRKPYKKESDKKVKCQISMTKKHYKKTAQNRSGIIREALDKYLLTAREGKQGV